MVKYVSGKTTHKKRGWGGGCALHANICLHMKSERGREREREGRRGEREVVIAKYFKENCLFLNSQNVFLIDIRT